MRRNREQRQPVESGVLGQSPLKPELATLIREGGINVDSHSHLFSFFFCGILNVFDLMIKSSNYYFFILISSSLHSSSII